MPDQKWKKYSKTAREALDESKANTSLITKQIDKRDPSLQPAGRKRKESGSSNRPPLPKCTEEESDQMRDLVGLKFGGYPMSEAAAKVGLNPTGYHGWLATREEAYQIAEHQHMERCLRAYQTNLWIVRTALSEVGPRAVRTLSTIMDDRKVPAGVRKDCAVQVLKLVDVDHSATGGTNEKMAKELVELLQAASRKIDSDNIIEAEEAEVIEDGEVGN